jgi:hypothetical protein
MGEAMGRRVAARLAAPAAGAGAASAAGDAGARAVRAAPLETVIEHLGGELALAGLGSLAMERWGRAMVLVLDPCPLGADASGLLEAVLEGALEAAAGRPVRALVLDRDAGRARLLIAGGAAVARVRAWLAGGTSWGDALVKLHGVRRGDA